MIRLIKDWAVVGMMLGAMFISVPAYSMIEDFRKESRIQSRTADVILAIVRSIDWKRWKASSGARRICVIGDAKNNFILFSYGQTNLGDEILEVNKNKSVDDIDSACDVVFITRVSPEHTRHYINKSKDRKILTISNDPNFIENGGLVQFTLVEEGVRLRIAKKAMIAQRIPISPYIFTIAGE